MSKNKDIIKVDLLRRKIREHFNNNPNSKSLIIKSYSNNGNFIWKVVRENNSQFKIVEVNTIKKEFLIKEAPIQPLGQPVGGQAPAAPMTQVPRNSFQAKQTNIQQFSQLDLPTKLAQLSSGMMLNYDTAISTFAEIVKDKSQDLVQLRRALEAGTNAANLDPNQKRLVGNILGILTSVSNERALMASKKNKGLQLKEASEEEEKDKKEKTRSK